MVYEVPETGFQRFLRNKYAPYAGIATAFALGLLFLYFGIYSIMCGSYIVGIFLYIIPKSFGADWKRLAVFGVMFLVIGSVFSAYAITKPALLSMEGEHSYGDFKSVSVTPFRGDERSYEFSVEYPLRSGDTIEMEYWEADMVYMRYVIPKGDAQNGGTPSGSPHQFSVTLEDGKIYRYRFIVTHQDGGDTKTSDSAYFTGPVTDDDSGLMVKCIAGNLYFVGIHVMLIFFLILLFTTWMRSGLERTRARLEAEGRLYPQGYGRCRKCGTMVLPGEVVCRKCGEYVDVPDEIRPKKVDYFVCSECGKEVPGNADVCPSCGESFEDEEVEVFDMNDGAGFLCSSCGARVGKDSVKCPSCGKEFEDD